MKFSQMIKKPEALAVLVSVGALAVSLFEPMKDWLAKPDITVGLPQFIEIGTAGGLGVPLVAPMVSIVNLGDAIGEFSKIECELAGQGKSIKMLAPSIDLSGTNAPVSFSPIVANPLKPGERFLNKVNCTSTAGLARQSLVTSLAKRAQSEVAAMGGVNCASQSETHTPALSDTLALDLEKFWEENFTIDAGEYMFSVTVYAKDGELLSSDTKSLSLSESDIAVIREQQKLLRKGYGTICPFGLYGVVTATLE